MSIQFQLAGHDKDLGSGFTVKRLLPSAKKQAVGPFIFFDHFGPIKVEPGENHDVRPHPHIGLATVTYLFEGAMMHRDSLGTQQRIEPGAINWMTAGKGIVHSERAPDDLKTQAYVNHGIQLWAALPQAFEETEPAFEHTPSADIPEAQIGAARVRVLIGSAFGKTSPVKTFAPTLYLDILVAPNGSFELPQVPGGPAMELAIYAIDHDIEVDTQAVAARTLVVLEPNKPATVRAPSGAQLIVVGGEPLDGHRLIWWNFVSSRKDRINQAADAWQSQAMGQVAGDAEFIPLPDRRPS